VYTDLVDVLPSERTKNGCAILLSKKFGVGIHDRFKPQDLFLSTEYGPPVGVLLGFCPSKPCIDNRGQLFEK